MFLRVLLLFLAPVLLFSAEITPQLLQDLFRGFFAHDPELKEYISNFPFEKYQIYKVENRDLYYVEKESTDYIKTEFIKKGIFYEVMVFEQLARYTRSGTIAIDVGGHIGMHTLNLSRLVGPGGVVCVFEPQLKLFTELVINMYLNNVRNVKFHRKALGHEQKWVEMLPYCPLNEGGVGIGSGGERVEMHRLDDYYLQNVSIIKIDTEWFELEVIEGAKKTIVRNKPVMVVEIMGGVFYLTATPHQKEEIHKRIKKIEELGYKVYHIALHDYLCIPCTRSRSIS